MTRAACHVLLHYSAARLSWKTIKTLRRSRSSPSSSLRDVSPVEYEVLQGWTVLAFHSLYVSTGIEYFVRFIVPFYFHFKMLLLIATFVVPSWAGVKRNLGGDGDRGSEYGLSPVVSYWFDYAIVPGVQRVHRLMDRDPRAWAVQQLKMAPLWFIDFFVLPGILVSDEEKASVRKRRSVVDTDVGERGMAVLPLEAFAHASAACGDEGSDSPMLIDEQTPPRDMKNGTPSASKEQNAKEEAKEATPGTEQSNGNESTLRTPPRRQRESPLFGLSPPIRSGLSPISTSKYSLSPAVKSRLASSAMRLRRFSREHQRSGGGGLVSPVNHLHHSKYAALGHEEEELNEEAKKAPPRETPGDDEAKAPGRSGRGRRRQRLSLGDHFRELVTGDASVRVRDHLFDLNREIPPSPRRPLRSWRGGEEGEAGRSRGAMGRGRRGLRGLASDDAQEDFDTSNISTRRSSRLAKKHSDIVDEH